MEIIRLLLNNTKIDLNFQPTINSPLNIAVSTNNKEVIQLLINHPTLNTQFKSCKNYLLCSSAAAGNIEIFQQLLKFKTRLYNSNAKNELLYEL